MIEHGRSGFLVDDIDEAVAAVRAVPDMNRAEVRAAFEQRFTADRMARDYVRLYRADDRPGNHCSVRQEADPDRLRSVA